MITAEQVTRAREILGWSIVDLARWSEVGQIAIFAFETGMQGLPERDLIDIKAVLELAVSNSWATISPACGGSGDE